MVLRWRTHVIGSMLGNCEVNTLLSTFLPTIRNGWLLIRLNLFVLEIWNGGMNEKPSDVGGCLKAWTRWHWGLDHSVNLGGIWAPQQQNTTQHSTTQHNLIIAWIWEAFEPGRINTGTAFLRKGSHTCCNKRIDHQHHHHHHHHHHQGSHTCCNNSFMIDHQHHQRRLLVTIRKHFAKILSQ